jgi:hypothetical protein
LFRDFSLCICCRLELQTNTATPNDEGVMSRSKVGEGTTASVATTAGGLTETMRCEHTIMVGNNDDRQGQSGITSSSVLANVSPPSQTIISVVS